MSQFNPAARAVCAAALLAGCFLPAHGQSSRRVNATRKARIERNIQDTYSHRWEVAGGGGWLRFKPGDQLFKANEVNFWMSGTRQWNPTWGLVADVRGFYGNATIPNALSLNNVFKPQISHYTFTAGVQRRFLLREKYSVSGVITGGTALSKFSGGAKGLQSTEIGIWKDSDAKPAFIVGANLDYNLFNNFAVRVQPNYTATTFSDTLQNSYGVSAGFIYRFGRQ